MKLDDDSYRLAKRISDKTGLRILTVIDLLTHGWDYHYGPDMYDKFEYPGHIDHNTEN